MNGERESLETKRETKEHELACFYGSVVSKSQQRGSDMSDTIQSEHRSPCTRQLAILDCEEDKGGRSKGLRENSQGHKQNEYSLIYLDRNLTESYGNKLQHHEPGKKKVIQNAYEILELTR